MSDSVEHDPAMENLLRSVRVHMPGTALDARLNAVFAGADVSRRLRLRLGRLAIAAGVMVVAAPLIWLSVHGAARRSTVAMRGVPTSHPDAVATVDVSLRIERDFSQVVDDGIVVSNNTPYQQTRRNTVRDILYVDPQTHSRLLVRVPTEQILVEKAEAF